MRLFESVYPTIPVTDLAKAKDFYQNVLGLTLKEEMAQGLIFGINDAEIYIYQRGPSKADHTLAGFRVENLEKTMDDLTTRGVRFEHYDYPGLKTDDKGIVNTPPVKAAWFKDPDGNIFGITQRI